MKDEMQDASYGEKAVGLFDQEINRDVIKCKKTFALIIDNLNNLRDSTEDPEVMRMASIAISEAQTSQMWAVKAITWKD